jgi:hypothetical protein
VRLRNIESHCGLVKNDLDESLFFNNVNPPYVPGLEIEAIPFLDWSPSTTVTRGWSDAAACVVASLANALPPSVALEAAAALGPPDPDVPLFVALPPLAPSGITSSSRRPRKAAEPSRGATIKRPITASSRRDRGKRIGMVDGIMVKRTNSIGRIQSAKSPPTSKNLDFALTAVFVRRASDETSVRFCEGPVVLSSDLNSPNPLSRDGRKRPDPLTVHIYPVSRTVRTRSPSRQPRQPKLGQVHETAAV